MLFADAQRHAQELFTAAIAAYLAKSTVPQLKDHEIARIEAQAIKQAQVFEETTAAGGHA